MGLQEGYGLQMGNALQLHDKQNKSCSPKRKINKEAKKIVYEIKIGFWQSRFDLAKTVFLGRFDSLELIRQRLYSYTVKLPRNVLAKTVFL